VSFVHADRVKETSTTSGAGTYTLAGAAAGFQSFAVIGDGNLCYYTAEDGTNWECGIGTYAASGTSLARTQILASSNAGAAVNWSGATKNIFVSPAGARFPEFAADIAAPANPGPGFRWFDLINGILATYLSDGVASAFIELGPQGIPDMADLWKILTADDTGQNINTVQPWFPTSGSIDVAAATTYRCMGFLHLTRSAGTTSHTTGIGFGGTATLTSMRGFVDSNTGDVLTTLAIGRTLMNAATSVTAKAASTSATEEAYFWGVWTIRVNAAGTLIPQFTYSAAPGGVPTVRANSFLYLSPIGTNNAAAQGNWH
jgi:hypothetical protein